ncbi:MAG: cytochrome b N-terminal domain-containing protein [Candidatus Riflebacteria bacterium]|nr:cytochrome b N-terminal domain-containing protein [Candidatus Riflebacteria bacterium]
MRDQLRPGSGQDPLPLPRKSVRPVRPRPRRTGSASAPSPRVDAREGRPGRRHAEVRRARLGVQGVRAPHRADSPFRYRRGGTVFGTLLNRLIENRVFRSIVRHGFPDSNRNRSLASFTNFFLHLQPVKVRLKAIEFTRTFYLGGLSLACLLILSITGVLLMFYYHPSVPRAYDDMKDLEFVVSQGVFLRNMHRWAAHLMVLLVSLHMIRVFYAGAYRPPREFNWVIGVVLLLFTVLLSYTGYLLPWDQLAYWAVTVGTNMARAVPAIGEEMRFLMLGGHTVNENALIRFYVLHCVALPAALFLGIAIHLWRVRKDGGVYVEPGEGGEVRG